jgi:hypothetical protein
MRGAEGAKRVLRHRRVLFAVARAAARVTIAERRLGLEAAAVSLRRTALRRPRAEADALLSAVDDLLPYLPPRRRLGACYKRSLLLLDLWSRCGLEPRLHLGVRVDADGNAEAHAWVSTTETTDAGLDFVEVLEV